MNEWAELHGESLSDFDPMLEPEPNGEWRCRHCGGSNWTWRSGEDHQFCVRCNKPMVWVPDDPAEATSFCDCDNPQEMSDHTCAHCMQYIEGGNDAS